MASALPEAVAPEESADLALPSEAPASKIPPELVQLTIEQLRYDSAALRTFSLVSKQWLHIGRSYLFSHIFLSAPRADSPATPCSRLYEVLSLSPGIALNIRHITIIAGAAHRDSPRTSRILRWISLDQTLPLFLDLLRNTNPNRIQSLHIRLSSERWVDLPDVLRESIRSLVNLATMTDVDLTGFDVVDATIFRQCRGLKSLKLAEIANDMLLCTPEEGPGDSFPQCESLTVLDTVHVGNIIAWAIQSGSFRALRELRLGFHPLGDVQDVENLLAHIQATLESLHLQPVYTPWPVPANFIDISALRVLTSLRLSIGLSTDCNPFPWVIFVLSQLGPNTLRHLTIDLRVGETRSVTKENVLTLPWAEFDAALNQPYLAGLRALTFTFYAYKPAFPFTYASSQDAVDWLKDELPVRLLPRSHARHVFEAYELEFTTTRFFYWPGPLTWSGSLGVDD